MKIATGVMIKIKWGNNWIAANDEQVQMFNQYRSHNRYQEAPFHCNDAVIFRENNDPHTGIHIRMNQNTNHKLPICDWNDVKIFLVDQQPVDWHRARDYQTWAFYDYIYDNKPTKTYISNGTTNRTHQTDTVIDLDHLYPGIVFTLGRNENNSIYFERNDRSRFRISDNEWSRLGFRGFYYRITMDPGMIVIPPQHEPQNKIPLPLDAIAEETDNENHQCVMCVSNKINIKFLPCGHAIGCSGCYIKMDKNECPICKKTITNIVKI
jgi:hypothetical protein